jgi:hypothetical protein
MLIRSWNSFLFHVLNLIAISCVWIRQLICDFSNRYSHLVRYGVLGPILVIVYVNDISDLTHGKTIMYADDTSVVNIGQDMNSKKTTSGVTI